MKQESFVPEFVDAMPEEIEGGRLYISVRFRTAAHLCARGCERRVVTPIKPAKWSFTYNGQVVSLSPSIGRWQLPCQSHYWIRNNQVIWSRAFTEKEIDAVMRRDARDTERYYAERRQEVPPSDAPRERSGLFARLLRRIKR